MSWLLILPLKWYEWITVDLRFLFCSLSLCTWKLEMNWFESISFSFTRIGFLSFDLTLGVCCVISLSKVASNFPLYPASSAWKLKSKFKHACHLRPATTFSFAFHLNYFVFSPISFWRIPVCQDSNGSRAPRRWIIVVFQLWKLRSSALTKIMSR